MRTMKSLILTLILLVTATLSGYGQGVVKQRPGTEGQNDFWTREIIAYTYPRTTTTNNDSVEITKSRIALTGSKYDATNDTLHRIVWAFENLTSDTLAVTITKDPQSQNGNAPVLADLAGYEPAAVTVNPGQTIHYYWTYGIYAQYTKVYIKVKAQASNVSILAGSRWRFYFIGF
jgi:plastocyanin